MGHTNFESLRNMVRHGQLGEVDTLTGIPSFCEPCVMGKMKKLPFKRSTTPASRPLQFVSCDVGGPVDPAAIGGYLYWIVIVCHYSSGVYTLFTKKKSEVYKKLRQWRIDMEHQ
ncbi:hypothetical protein GGG16DRAFT_13426, partial [Schizophyllum commune]